MASSLHLLPHHLARLHEHDLVHAHDASYPFPFPISHLSSLLPVGSGSVCARLAALTPYPMHIIIIVRALTLTRPSPT